MKVHLRKPAAFSACSKKPVESVNWHIYLDEQFVGTMDEQNLRPYLALQLDAGEMRTMMKQLRKRLAPREVQDAVQPPEPPKQEEDDAEYVDPFEAFG